MYLIYLKDIDLNVSIGIHDFERRRPQPFRVSVTLIMADRVSSEDKIETVVDYDFVRDTVSALASSKHWELQESLCDEIASKCAAPASVLGAVVRTCKPAVYDDVEEVGCVSATLKPALPDNFQWWTINV